MSFINSIGIDTIRFIIPSETLYKYLNKNELKVLSSSRNYLINKYFEQKEIKQNRDFDVKFVEIGNTRNLSGYILIKTNMTSINLSKNSKKSKSYFVEIIFAGLRQPTKSISMNTYKILAIFIKRFKVADIDICCDGINKLSIDKSTFNNHCFLFKDYINGFQDVEIEKTSFYINNPSSPTADADYFKKILLYDKYIKESRYKELDESFKNWKRLEFTLKVQFKLKGFNLDDYIKDIVSISKRYFSVTYFSYEYLNLQIKLLTDKRTHRGKTL